MTNSLSTSVRFKQTLYPYASSMIMDFGLTADRSETGYFAGFVCGSVMLGRAVGAPIWGWCADRYGRKPVLLISLFSIAVGSISFGVAASFPVAIGSLLFCGVFCSLSAIGKTCVSEVVGPSQQAKAMSYYALGWFYGQIAGYLIGGFLVHPERSGLVSGGVLAQYPYLLPNLVCAMLALLNFAGIALFFKETLHQESAAASLSVEFLKAPSICQVISLYSIEVFCNTGFIETFPLWCWSSRLHGGLDMSAEEIGLTLSLSYALLCAVQSRVYQKVFNSLGLIGTVAVSTLVTAPTLLIVPTLSVFEGWKLLAIVVVACLVFYLLAFNIFTSVFVITNNTVSVGDRAKMNGCSMSIGYIIKGGTPLLVGYSFAYSSESGREYPFNHHFVFVVLAAASVGAAVLAMTLGKHLEGPVGDQYNEMHDTSKTTVKEIELEQQKDNTPRSLGDLSR